MGSEWSSPTQFFMELGEWFAWAVILYIQQLTFLFSGRAKTSGSLKYSAIAGFFSHGSWFFSNLYFVQNIFQYRDAHMGIKMLICMFYITFTVLGTISAQWVALRYETGRAKVGAS